MIKTSSITALRASARPLRTRKTAASEILKFVPLGGLEEIGRNMMFFEYGDDIVVIDAGLQFPEEDTPGIDYIIPNTSYLEANRHKIRALVITHAHYDHIGAIPYLIGKIGNPPIYAAAITKEIIKKRQEDFPNLPKLNIEIVKHGDKIKPSKNFTLEFFDVDHTVPDTLGVLLHTPAGTIAHFPDFKFDYNKEGKPQGLDVYERIGKMGVHALFMDSTNAEEEGYSISERVVEKNLEELFQRASGRVIVATFASLITRLGEMIKIAGRIDRKVFVSGYSMKANLQAAQNLGYIKPEPNTMRPIEEVSRYRDEKILILCTGAQGESNAQLMKIATGEHRFIQVKRGDTIILSASIIPGNERGVQILKDNFTRLGARVYQSKDVDIHSSGHAPKEELKAVLRLVRPRFFVPVHGYYFMRAKSKELAQEVGMRAENVFLMDNGDVAEITADSFRVNERGIDASYVLVDGLGIGDVGEVVLRDRLTLAKEGMIVVIVTMTKDNWKILKNPDIISRGFIYLKENQELLDEIRRRIRSIVTRIPSRREVDTDYLKTLMRDQIGQYLYTKTKRRPMILPVVIEI